MKLYSPREPSDDQSQAFDELRDAIAASRIPERARAWVTTILTDLHLPRVTSESERLRDESIHSLVANVIEPCFASCNDGTVRPEAVLLFFDAVRLNVHGAGATKEELLEKIVRLQDEAFDLNEAFLGLPPERRGHHGQFLLPFARSGEISMAKLLDLEALGGEPDRAFGSDPSGPEGFSYWFGHFRWKAIEDVCQIVAAAPDETVAGLARGVSAYTHELAWSHVPRPSEIEDPARDAARLLLDAISRRVDRLKQDVVFLDIAWNLALIAYGDGQHDFDGGLRERLSNAASFALGDMRGLLRSHEDSDQVSLFKARTQNPLPFHFLPPYEAAVEFLERFRALWAALKPLLVGLRVLETPCVGPDLRTWRELRGASQDPPEPWAWIARTFAERVEGERGDAGHEARVKACLEPFAKYCLERMKPRKDGLLAEVESVWRACFIHALSVLRENPRGAGHKLLLWIAHNDPEPEVKKVSRSVHKVIRRGHPRTVSPRRAMMAAFWWMRQAHRQTLRGDVVPARAQRTYDKEARRMRSLEEIQ
ncbi:MAG: hypothetical protein O7H41_21545 [Planctomycetota bacterium]|nr:hypothetical protein [Planctomycetota bacterium]